MSTTRMFLNALLNKARPYPNAGYAPAYSTTYTAPPVYGPQPYATAAPIYGPPPPPMMQQPGYYSAQNSFYPPVPAQPYTQPCDPCYDPALQGPGYY